MSVPTEAVLDQMADAAIYADRGGKIQLWNRAAAALFGYEAAEALGSSIDIIVPERLREPHWRGFEAAMASGTLKLSGRPTLTRALHKDGSRLYIEMSFALPIAFGDWKAGYQIVEKVGIRWLRDPYSQKPYVLTYAYRRVGGDVANSDAIKLMKVSA